MSVTLCEDPSAFHIVDRDLCSSTTLKRILFIPMGTRLCILLTATYEGQQCVLFSFSLYCWAAIRKRMYKHKNKVLISFVLFCLCLRMVLGVYGNMYHVSGNKWFLSAKKIVLIQGLVVCLIKLYLIFYWFNILLILGFAELCTV